MVGLGGGFIAVPVLLLFFRLPPAQASGTALGLVVANSGAGALTYLLQKRVAVRIGVVVALGGFPGSIVGAVLATRISTLLFDSLFAALLLLVAFDMAWNRRKRAMRPEKQQNASGMPWTRSLVLGFGVGLISSLFGVGGGVVLVPSLLYFSNLPAHMISATSHFGIFLTSPVGFATHWLQHDIVWTYVAPLMLGGVLGGPIGARLSLRLPQAALIALVASALAIAAIALIVRDIIA